jgi:hypothetical protein
VAKVNFTTFLYASPVQMIPACDTGTPAIEFDGFLHFTSSTHGVQDVCERLSASDEVVRADDLLMIGLVYHTAHFRYHYGWNQAGGPNAKS